MSQTQIRQKFNLQPMLSLIQKFGSALLVIAIAFGGYFAAHYLLPGSGHTATELEEHFSGTPVANADSLIVLSEEKLQAAKLTTSIVELRPFEPHKRVPATISYDAAKKVDLRSAVDAVVEEVLVELGQSVQAGDELLVLAGPETGQARIAIEQAESNVNLAQTELEWSKNTNENLIELFALLNHLPTVDQVNKIFANKMLGEHRDEIMSAYSQYQLAKRSVNRSSNADMRDVIPGRVLDERRSRLEVADAKFNGLLEESKFHSAQDFTKAKAKYSAAENELEICRDKLTTLIGPFGDAVAPNIQARGKNLSRFVLKAPRDGQVVELMASASSRFEAGEIMLVIAETSDVWVEAQIPQRELASLDIVPGQSLSVTVPGMENQTFSADVRFFSASVSATTLAVPLVAELDNAKHVFRPGMFVWVSVPIGKLTNAVTVPVGAIQRDGDDTFVFLAEGGGKFRRVDVEAGAESDGWVEVRSGLTVGDKLVDGGAFFLKSELLLEAD